MNELNQYWGGATVSGAPLDPALGLPRAVVKEKKWEALGELIAGVGLVAISVAWLVATVTGTSKDGRWPLAFVFMAIGPFVGIDGYRRLRRGSCVIIAANGFDDRSGSDPAGPVLWSEVQGMEFGWATDVRMGASFISAKKRKQLVITLKPVKRMPLSPSGPPPKPIDKACILLDNMEGGDKRLPEAMRQAYQSWRDDQAARHL